MRLIHLFHCHGDFGKPPVVRRNILSELARSLLLKIHRNRIKMSGEIGFHNMDSSRSCGILMNDSESFRTTSQNSDYSLPSIGNTHSDVSDISTDNITLDSAICATSDKTCASTASAKSRSESEASGISEDNDIHNSTLPCPMPRVSMVRSLRFLSPSSSRGSVRSLDSFKCPCCLRLLESPRLLNCLHSVCTPCLNKVEALLRSYEKNTKKSVHWEKRPLGKFLCPLCNSLEIIPRQGICLIPVNIPVVHSMAKSRNHSYPSPCPSRCGNHGGLSDMYCFTCNIQLCSRCVDGDHRDHSVDHVDKVSTDFSEALENAVNEISQRMKDIEKGIGKIKAAREVGKKEKKELRKTVQSYYEGYVQDVREHTDKLEKQIRKHHAKNFNMLLKEELQLEQYKDDLNLLCDQIDLILKSKKNIELAKFIIPVAKRLKVISENIMNIGEAITDRLAFIPSSISDTDIPGILSTFTISQNNSYLILDRPIYEKVVCSVQLVLMDKHGMRLEVYKDLDVAAIMTIFQKETKTCKSVNVSFERQADRSIWQLSFTPPFHGIAHLSVTIDGIHIKNSPYVITVRKLFLDTSFLSRSNSKQSKVTKINV